MMARVEFDFTEMGDFFDRLNRVAQGQFKKDVALFLEGLGVDFLRIVQDEIIRRDVTNTRLLLVSFEKGADDNIWEISADGLTLEVGTNVDYASFVNDGHWTNPKGVERRFVPGYWRGNEFVYDPDAKGGMTLKQKWVEGKHFWESAERLFQKMYPKELDKKMQEWLDRYFSNLL